MKTKHQILIAFSLILSTTACENAVKVKEEIKTEIKVEKTAHEDESAVQLNKGERWAANVETTEGVNNLIKLTDSFTETKSTVAYKTLTDSLESGFTMIFSKCTMKGEAHNQLHNYLFPMKSMFKKLSSEELIESQAAYDTLKEHLSLYKNYFE